MEEKTRRLHSIKAFQVFNSQSVLLLEDEEEELGELTLSHTHFLPPSPFCCGALAASRIRPLIFFFLTHTQSLTHIHLISYSCHFLLFLSKTWSPRLNLDWTSVQDQRTTEFLEFLCLLFYLIIFLEILGI